MSTFRVDLKGGGTFGKIWIDDKEIENVRGLTITTRYDERAVVEMEMIHDRYLLTLENPFVKARKVCPLCGSSHAITGRERWWE